jgi:hypothetical protein
MSLMTARVAAPALILITLGACQPAAKPPMTPLELQSLQTQEFEASKKATFAAVMTVFQDLGYVIESADIETGFITAEGPTTDTGNFWTGVAETSVSEQAKATAFVEERSKGRTRVRLNFVVSRQTSTKEGRTSSSDTPIHDAEMYQSVFNRIDQAIFVRSATD